MAELYGRLDIPMINRAARDRFDIPDETRKAVVSGMHAILIDKEESASSKSKAASVIARLDGLNLKQQQLFMPMLHLEGNTALLTDEEITLRLEELGKQLETTDRLSRVTTWLPTSEDQFGEPHDARIISEPEPRLRGPGSTRAESSLSDAERKRGHDL